MNTTIRVIAISCLAQLLVQSARGAEPPELENNPFSRPRLLPVATGTAPLERLESPPPRLLATMVSSSQRLANVEGQVIEVGDAVRGHVLREVFSDRATFEHAGNEVVVRVKPEPEDDDE